MKENNTGKALLASVISMVLCLTLLLETTLAWFTNTAVNTNNRITTGILDVRLLKYQGTGYADISGGEGDIFNDGSVQGGEPTHFWEPNMTEVVLLSVKNNGNLALDYNINLVITPDEGQTANLEKVMSYAIISGFDATDYRGEVADETEVVLKDVLKNAGITSWETLIGFNEEGYTVETAVLPTGEVKAAPNGALEAGKSDCFLLAVHMDASAGNEYQGLGLTIDVKVDAKQQDFEADSFGTEYDKDALWVEKLQSGPAIPAIPDEYLNTNLFKDSGFDARLVSDSGDGWVSTNKMPVQIVENVEGYSDGKVLSLSGENVDGITSGVYGVYQTIDLTKYCSDLSVIQDYQYQLSGRLNAIEGSDSSSNKLYARIHAEYIDSEGNVLNSDSTQVFQVRRKGSGWATFPSDNLPLEPQDFPEGTTKINIYLALRYSGSLTPVLYWDNVEFIITKK